MAQDLCNTASAAATACSPLQNQQVQIIRSKSDPNYKPPYTTVSACVRATLRENGFKGPFQGLGATLLRNTPANAVYLGTFEVLKGQAAQRLGCKVGG